jgi:hypothetical protein
MNCPSLHRLHGSEMEDAKMECSHAVLSLATVGLLSLGSFIGFTVLVMFALARAPPDTAKPDLVAVPGDAAAVIWQAADVFPLGATSCRTSGKARLPKTGCATDGTMPGCDDRAGRSCECGNIKSSETSRDACPA